MIHRGNSTAFPNTPKVVDMPAYKRINIEEETMTQTILRNISEFDLVDTMSDVLEDFIKYD